jgi:hypothetical protein
MSTPVEKVKNATRRHRDEVAVKKQTRIARQSFRVGDSESKDLKNPHRFAKRHAFDCGRPQCMLCGNPRKISKEQTIQEQRFYQNTDESRDRHSNGLPPENNNED